VVRAYAPGSVTTVFAPAEDPEGGSLGVSFATADGVRAEVTPAAATSVTLDGEAAAVDPVAHVLEEFGVTARVELQAAVPVGYGFGASGAATLAVALAAAAAFDLDLGRAALVDAAHRAEVRAGTGLGDVYVQDRGGLVWNTGEGIGRVDLDARVEYEAIAGMETGAVLGDDDRMDRIGRAGRAALSSLDPSAGLDQLFERSWEFAREMGLATDRVAETVDRVVAADGAATMAMLGETVVATGVDGVLDGATRIGTDGAHLLE
jgi:pantoate kinase